MAKLEDIKITISADDTKLKERCPVHSCPDITHFAEAYKMLCSVPRKETALEKLKRQIDEETRAFDMAQPCSSIVSGFFGTNRDFKGSTQYITMAGPRRNDSYAAMMGAMMAEGLKSGIRTNIASHVTAAGKAVKEFMDKSAWEKANPAFAGTVIFDELQPIAEAFRLETTNYKEAQMEEKDIRKALEENGVKVADDGTFSAWCVVDSEDYKKGAILELLDMPECYVTESDAIRAAEFEPTLVSQDKYKYLSIMQILEPDRTLVKVELTADTCHYYGRCNFENGEWAMFVRPKRIVVTDLPEIAWEIKFDIVAVKKRQIRIELYNDKTGARITRNIDHHFGTAYSKLDADSICNLVNDYVQNDADRINTMNACQGCSLGGMAKEKL